MNAEIIAVGSEMLTPWRQDTNSLFITERLNEIGIEVRLRAVVGDDRERLGRVFLHALERADLVVLTGGLGPTDDDVTREVVAAALNRPLVEREELTEAIRRRFASRNLVMPEINRRQAMVPEGADVLPNANGTAPGLWLEHGPAIVVLLPGPPREMKPMVERLIVDRLAARAGETRIFRRVVKVTGRSESHAEEAVQPAYKAWGRKGWPIDATILAAFGQIELHLSISESDSQKAVRILDQAVADLQTALGADIFSIDGRQLEEVVGTLLREQDLRIALAESCTGGLTTTRLTDVPGSSAYVERGFVVYSNASKTELLGVPASLIEEAGAVSEHVAVAMAQAVRDRSRVDLGVGITGIAGPGGGTPEKPVGTVVIAVARRGGTTVRTFRLLGGRDQIRFQASQAALDMVRRLLQS